MLLDFIHRKLSLILFLYLFGITTDQNAFQVIAAYMMIINLNQKGYNAFAISIPSPSELLAIFELAAPVFVMMMSKVYYILPDFRPCICLQSIISMHLRPFGILGSLLHPPYIFCYIDGNNHLGCSSGQFVISFCSISVTNCVHSY